MFYSSVCYLFVRIYDCLTLFVEIGSPHVLCFMLFRFAFISFLVWSLPGQVVFHGYLTIVNELIPHNDNLNCINSMETDIIVKEMNPTDPIIEGLDGVYRLAIECLSL